MKPVAILLLFVLTGAMIPVAAPARAAPVPKHLMKPADTDLTKIQGRWKVESMRFGKGKDDALPGGNETIFDIRGTKLNVTSNSKPSVATLTLDVVDGVKRFAVTEIQEGDRREKDASFGYKLDEDKLTLATMLADTLKAVDPEKAGDGALVIVLTRLPDKK